MRVTVLTVLAQAHVERAVGRALVGRLHGHGRPRGRRRAVGACRRISAVTGWTVTLVVGLVFRVGERSVVGSEPVRFYSSFALDFLLETTTHSDARV